ncbi:MAG: hypothetical protein P4L57_07900 [Rhizomicrobium sp.]|nr:hypothetical protein [Rhizomicrobium sp.]
MAIFAGFAGYFVSFLHHVLVMPHVVYAGVVALFFGIVTASRPGLVVVPIIAAVVYIAALALGPVVLNNAALVVPAFDVALARELIAAYLLFLVADTIVYIIKKIILGVID